jgi:hypothetical protein
LQDLALAFNSLSTAFNLNRVQSEEFIYRLASTVQRCIDNESNIASWLGIYSDSVDIQYIPQALELAERLFSDGRIIIKNAFPIIHNKEVVLCTNDSSPNILFGDILMRYIQYLMEIKSIGADKIDGRICLSPNLDLSPSIMMIDETIKILTCGKSTVANLSELALERFSSVQIIIESYELASELLKLLKASRSFGMTCYSNYDKSFYMTASIEELQDEIRHVEMSIQSWNKKLSICRKAAPRMNLLSSKQLGVILHLIAQSNSSQISAHLYVCFPEAGRSEDYNEADNSFVLGMPAGSSAVRAALNNIVLELLMHYDLSADSPIDILTKVILAAEVGLISRSKSLLSYC